MTVNALEGAAASRGSYELLETADPLRDPEGLVSKFVRYEYLRLNREKLIDDMVGSISERMAVLFWYLCDYARHRSYKYELPLSAKQTSFLNQQALLSGASPALTVALHNFVLRDWSVSANLRDTSVLTDAAYWWCVEFAPALKLEDRLVTEDQVALLRADVQWVGEEFPLNSFMIRFFNKHVELHSLDMNLRRDRAAFFCYLVLHSFEKPHVLRFLPREGLRRLVREQAGAPSMLDRAIARFCFADRADDEALEAARALRKSGEALLARRGLRLDWDAPPRKLDVPSGECFLPQEPPLGAKSPGVAVIGPVYKTSGLGQATRLSLDILALCDGAAPTALDFDLDNPAPIGFASKQSLSPYRERRNVNLIHLNAESIPLAFAFASADVFAQSYNVGYFFWELDKIPKCHELALDLLDEIWVSSEYNRQIYAGCTTKPVVNVGMAVEALPDVVSKRRADLYLDEDCFVFLTTFDSFSFIERKNPLGVIEAFQRAFGDGERKVRLVLKTQNRYRVTDPYQVSIWKRIDNAIRKDPRIIVINETYAYRDLLGLKQACDCYVSLHRSEGWGFGLIEAMQLSLPVIATAYSGNVDFCTAETAYLVDYELTDVREEEYIFVPRGSRWASPDLDVAAAHMRSVVDDREAARRKGRAAAAFIQKNFSVAAIARRYADALETIASRTA